MGVLNSLLNCKSKGVKTLNKGGTGTLKRVEYSLNLYYSKSLIACLLPNPNP